MRYALMAVLALGVVGGYGSAIARAAYWRGACHASAGGHGWHGGDWREARWQERRDEVKVEPKAAPQPQTVVVQQPAPAPAAAPQIFLIMPGAQPQAVAPQTVVVPMPVTQATTAPAPTP